MANPQMFVEVVASGGQAAVTVVGHGDNVGDAFGDDEDFVIVLNTAANDANAAITDVLEGTPVTPALATNSAILSNTTTDGDILFAVSDGGHSKGLLKLDGSEGVVIVHNSYLDVKREGNSGISPQAYSTTPAEAAFLNLERSRNDTIAGGHTAVADDDVLGYVSFRGSDGDSFESGAQIKGMATETWSGSAMGTELLFYTTANTTHTSLIERMRIHSTGEIDLIGDVGIGAGTGSGALTVTNTGSSTPTALLLRNLTAVGSADTGVNIVWHGNDTGQSMASQAVAWEGTDNNDVYMTFQTRTSDSITEKMRIKSTGEVDLQGISTGGLINVGASGNNWTATAINIAGTNPNITSEATNGNGAAQLTVKVPASGSGGDAGILIGEGNAGGAAGNQGYYLQYRPGSGYFRFLSTNIDGSATNGDIWRVADSGTVMLLNDDHGTNFDYVCDSCGRAEIEFFECCGTVAWHDDVLALREMALNREGLEHMAKLGVMDISNNDDGVEWIGLNLQGAQHFTWSAMHQMYERINELETKLEALGV